MQAARALWRLVGVGAELRAHLAALRAYFLLGSGDLFQAFLLEARWQNLAYVLDVAPSER